MSNRIQERKTGEELAENLREPATEIASQLLHSRCEDQRIDLRAGSQSLPLDVACTERPHGQSMHEWVVYLRRTRLEMEDLDDISNKQMTSKMLRVRGRRMQSERLPGTVVESERPFCWKGARDDRPQDHGDDPQIRNYRCAVCGKLVTGVVTACVQRRRANVTLD